MPLLLKPERSRKPATANLNELEELGQCVKRVQGWVACDERHYRGCGGRTAQGEEGRPQRPRASALGGGGLQGRAMANTNRATMNAYFSRGEVVLIRIATIRHFLARALATRSRRS